MRPETEQIDKDRQGLALEPLIARRHMILGQDWSDLPLARTPVEGVDDDDDD